MVVPYRERFPRGGREVAQCLAVHPAPIRDPDLHECSGTIAGVVATVGFYAATPGSAEPVRKWNRYGSWRTPLAFSQTGPELQHFLRCCYDVFHEMGP